ncbi:uncharacterized protein TNCV_2729351 [Trichonephila clavipes]|nr:uncharacterized protein TNCV_2729351 [Trichonephila clavipes]
MWIGLRSQSHLRFGFDSDSRPSSFALPLQAPTGEGAGSGESLSVHNCYCCGYIRFLLFVSLSWSCMCVPKWKTRKHLTARKLQLRKQEEFVIIMLIGNHVFFWLNKCDEDNTKGYCKLCKNSFTVAYDGLKAVTHHAEAKKHKEWESAAAMSHQMKSFFTPKGSAQSEKVGITELTEVYHSIKHHISYVAQNCSLKVLKQVINDSDIVKQMTGGRTKCTALVKQVLFLYSMELVQEDLKNDVSFSVATDASNKGNRKNFPVAIQYFSPKSGICHKILDFYEDSLEDSTSIKERICEVMDKSRLP